MEKKKRQHYVPQFYLRNFVREDNKFTIFNIKSEKIIENAPYTRQCYEDYYYGDDEVWEEKLGVIESSAALVIAKINEQTNYYPNVEEIKILKKFILYQRYRTIRNKDNLLNIRWNGAKTYVEMNLRKEGKYVSENTIKVLKKEFEKRYDRIIPQQALEITTNLLDNIEDLELLIIQYNNKIQHLISSDNPVVFYNPFYQRAVGLMSAGLIILLPISSSKLIVIFDSKMYQRYKNNKIVKLTNENEVKMLNIFQLIVAKEIVYFQNKSQAQFIKIYYKKNKDKRELFEELGKPLVMGTDNNKMIACPQQFIPIDYNFSFGKVHSKGIGFIENEVDWFPRKRDEVYENRMKTKPQIFKNLPPLKGKFSKKNIKNIERFNRFVYDYWNNKL